MPELARSRADGVIDRSKTRGIPLDPSAAEGRSSDPSAAEGRSSDWNLCRGNHLGQRSCASATTGRTYGRKRSDQSTAQPPCEERAVHIWIKEGKGAIKWTRLSCRSFAANAVRLQLHALAYNLGNFLRTLALGPRKKRAGQEQLLTWRRALSAGKTSSRIFCKTASSGQGAWPTRCKSD